MSPRTRTEPWPDIPAERAYPTKCPRCRHKSCTGRFTLITCKAEYDGMTGFDEAEQLLRNAYVLPETPVGDEARPALMTMHYGNDILTPWVPEDDRRPRARGGPREGAKWVKGKGFTLPGGETLGSGSAMHGECTQCVKDAHADDSKTIRAATWRRQAGPLPENFVYCKASYCDFHANKFASAPIEVPQFKTAEEAQAWLDKITEERTAS